MDLVITIVLVSYIQLLELPCDMIYCTYIGVPGRIYSIQVGGRNSCFPFCTITFIIPVPALDCRVPFLFIDLADWALAIAVGVAMVVVEVVVGRPGVVVAASSSTAAHATMTTTKTSTTVGGSFCRWIHRALKKNLA
jgi:hypothetical protein